MDPHETFRTSVAALGESTADVASTLSTLALLDVACRPTSATWRAFDAQDDEVWYPTLRTWLRDDGVRRALGVALGGLHLDAAALAPFASVLGRTERAQFSDWCAQATPSLRRAWTADGGTPSAVASAWFASSWGDVRERLGIRAWHSDAVVAVVWMLASMGRPPPSGRIARRAGPVAPDDALRRWNAALAALPPETRAGLSRGQRLTALHPRWRALWTQSGWSVRRRVVDAVSTWRAETTEAERDALCERALRDATVGSGSA